ncbi:MAG: 2,3-bisphosphoglycerate-dependent phosphoglycerate mutase [Candidatus Caenarcaniphilales bacterium]|nr:2,3-bisphosphoglycerate-dependent phosphoglycerate mutase [Candidatus Caenarcaniphilales bacterium]
MSRLVLVRHGQSAWNLENRFTGWVDVDLSEKGFEEARQAGHDIKRHGLSFEVAFCSLLLRARKTLDIILEEIGQTGIEVIADQALNERHYGDLQGKNKAEVAKEFGDEQVQIWRRSYDIAPPGGESLKDTAARSIPYFDAHISPKLALGQNVIVSAHGNSLRSIVMKLDGLTQDQVLKLEIPTGSPLLYEYKEGQFKRIGYLSEY